MTCEPAPHLHTCSYENGLGQANRLVRPIHRYTFSSNTSNLMPSPISEYWGWNSHFDGTRYQPGKNSTNRLHPCQPESQRGILPELHTPVVGFFGRSVYGNSPPANPHHKGGIRDSSSWPLSVLELSSFSFNTLSREAIQFYSSSIRSGEKLAATSVRILTLSSKMEMHTQEFPGKIRQVDKKN